MAAERALTLAAERALTWARMPVSKPRTRRKQAATSFDQRTIVSPSGAKQNSEPQAAASLSSSRGLTLSFIATGASLLLLIAMAVGLGILNVHGSRSIASAPPLPIQFWSAGHQSRNTPLLAIEMWELAATQRPSAVPSLILHNARERAAHSGEAISECVLQTIAALALGPSITQLEDFLWESLALVNEQAMPAANRDFLARAAILAGLLPRLNSTFLRMSQAGVADVLEVMLVAGASVNAVSASGATALHIALDRWSEKQTTFHRNQCGRHDFDLVIEVLLQQPSLDISLVDATGRTLLMAAVQARHFSALQELLRRGTTATTLAALQSGETPLHTSVKVAHILIAASKWRTRHGNTYVDSSRFECSHDSIKTYNMSSASSLYDDSATRTDPTALRAEVYEWNAKFVQALLDAGANVSATDLLGRTALHYAARQGNGAALLLLLDAQAGTEQRDAFGHRAADHAADGGYEELAALLSEHTPSRRTLLPGTIARPIFVNRVSPRLPGWGRPRTVPVVQGEDLSRVRCDVDVREEIDSAEFARDFFSRQRPVLLRGALREDLGAWEREALQVGLDDTGLRVFTLASPRAGRSTIKPLPEFEAIQNGEQHKLSQHASDSTLSPDTVVEARWAPHAHLHNHTLELLDLQPVTGWVSELARGMAVLNNYQINVGSPFSGTSLHFHYMAVSALLHGRKRWFLYPPADASYSNAHFFDDFEPARRGQLGRQLECTQQAGDVLFVPSLWAHGVLYEENSVSVSFLYSDSQSSGGT